MSTQSKPECCPPFNPELWNDKLIEWNNKKFIRDKVFTFFFMPLNFGQVMKRLDTTCPKCAKKFGKNYVAVISEVA